jgi:hypothetical protein
MACASAGEVLAANIALPAYAAVIECVPAVSDEVVNDAIPPASVPVPIAVPPSRNVTVPVGVPLPLVIVAVNVTGAWKAAGYAASACPAGLLHRRK